MTEGYEGKIAKAAPAKKKVRGFQWSSLNRRSLQAPILGLVTSKGLLEPHWRSGRWGKDHGLVSKEAARYILWPFGVPTVLVLMEHRFKTKDEQETSWSPARLKDALEDDLCATVVHGQCSDHCYKQRPGWVITNSSWSRPQVMGFFQLALFYQFSPSKISRTEHVDLANYHRRPLITSCYLNKYLTVVTTCTKLPSPDQDALLQKHTSKQWDWWIWWACFLKNSQSYKHNSFVRNCSNTDYNTFASHFQETPTASLSQAKS